MSKEYEIELSAKILKLKVCSEGLSQDDMLDGAGLFNDYANRVLEVAADQENNEELIYAAKDLNTIASAFIQLAYPPTEKPDLKAAS